MTAQMEDGISTIAPDAAGLRKASVAAVSTDAATSGEHELTVLVPSDSASSGNMPTDVSDEGCKQMLKNYCRKGH